MADIRFKDLTTTASTTAADDFFAADGATNGTRKLSAYSPTFGGNATVGGTLTVSGVATASSGLVIGSGSFAEGKLYYGAFGGLTIAAKTGSSYDLYIAAPDGNAIGYVPTGTKTLTLPSTTASTSSSSGALVVGNGTSGGLGVGGNIHLGGDLNLNSASGQIVVSGTGNTANNKEVRLYRSDGGDWAVFGLTGTAYAGSLTGLGNSEAYIYNANPFRIFIGTAATNRFDFTSSQFKINATTASTGTSSGALVVSGGVGVAGNVSSGGQVAATGTGTSGPYIANSAVIDYDSSTARFYGRGPNTSTRPSLGFYSTYSDGAGGLTLMTFNASGAATISTGLTLSNTSQSRAAWGDVGVQLSIAGAVITDTSSSGTVSRAVVNSIAASALAASSTTTYTQAASLFVAGAPTANTNVTITNAYAIYTAGGRINFQGLPTSATGLQAGTLWNDGGTLKVA